MRLVGFQPTLLISVALKKKEPQSNLHFGCRSEAAKTSKYFRSGPTNVNS